MKKYLLILTLLLSLNCFGQNIIDKNTVVKTEAGMVMPYAVWQKMIQSGDYSLKASAPGAKDYVIYMLTDEQKAINAERLKSRIAVMGKPRASESFKEGDKYLGERMVDINGNKFDPKKQTEKIYVLNFWFINCPPCKKEIPDLNELVAKYKSNPDVIFIAIALDKREDLKEFLKTMPFNYNVVDDGRYYAQKYSVKSYPTHVVVGKDGLIKFSTLGLAPNTVYWIDKTIKEQLDRI